ncbi:MAG: hypothetical protein PVG39_04955 [Desulfobacteraceae bacterium]|jgi:hypothetical protein
MSDFYDLVGLHYQDKNESHEGYGITLTVKFYCHLQGQLNPSLPSGYDSVNVKGRPRSFMLKKVKMIKVDNILSSKEDVGKVRLSLEKKTDKAFTGFSKSKQKVQEMSHLKFLD